MLSKDEAELIYDLLILHVGATEQMREDFVLSETTRAINEFRFQGNLGFGGKFWIEKSGWHVSCYREDGSPERIKSISACNESLKRLFNVTH